MMITNLFIKNFKALRECNLTVSNLNVYTGLNGMGKSTILQALMLLRQSKKNIENELNLKNNDLVNIGTFYDAFCVAASDDFLELNVKFSDNSHIIFKAQSTPFNENETIIKNLNTEQINLDNALFGESSFMYLSADRIAPDSSFKTNPSLIGKKQLGNHGEYAPHFYQQNKNQNIPIPNLKYDEYDETVSLEYQVNQWLGVISPGVQVHTEIKVDIIVLQYSYISKHSAARKYKSLNAGFGLTYVFSVLVAILSAKKGDIIIIENPESHIHPKGQSELARLMALAAKNGVQIFCETHSDHILYGVRIAIKEKDINKDEVRVYYIDRDSEEHFSKPHLIKIDDNGRMDRDSKEYFLEYENHLDKLLG